MRASEEDQVGEDGPEVCSGAGGRIGVRSTEERIEELVVPRGRGECGQ